MIQKNIKLQLLQYFLDNPTSKLHLRAIERETNISFPSVVRYVEELIQEELLRKEQVSTTVVYFANRAHKNFILEKKLYNLRKIYESGLVEYIKENTSNSCIAVFGSFAKGEDIESSDIDIFIQTPTTKISLPARFEKKLGKKIQLFPAEHILDIENRHLVANMLSGITLHGQLDLDE